MQHVVHWTLQMRTPWPNLQRDGLGMARPCAPLITRPNPSAADSHFVGLRLSTCWHANHPTASDLCFRFLYSHREKVPSCHLSLRVTTDACSLFKSKTSRTHPGSLHILNSSIAACSRVEAKSKPPRHLGIQSPFIRYQEPPQLGTCNFQDLASSNRYLRTLPPNIPPPVVVTVSGGKDVNLKG
jgi:hypothetical protein